MLKGVGGVVAAVGLVAVAGGGVGSIGAHGFAFVLAQVWYLS